jgi:alpha-mannosidase
MKRVTVKSPASGQGGKIENQFYSLTARKGSSALPILHEGKPLFTGAGLSFIRMADPGGSWGGALEEKRIDEKTDVQEKWRITDYELLESGPVRAALWVRFSGERSRIDLTFQLQSGRHAVDVLARVFWNERLSRLRLILPVGEEAEFEVPGGRVTRGVLGEVPGGRWVRATGRDFGFASNALYSFGCRQGALHATITRASRYAYSVDDDRREERWRPAVDAGELNFRFLLTARGADLERLAQELEQPLISLPVPPHPGPRPPAGSLFELAQANVQLLALKRAEDGRGWIARMQETAGKKAALSGTFLDRPVTFGNIEPWAIATFRIEEKAGAWQARPTDIQEAGR